MSTPDHSSVPPVPPVGGPVAPSAATAPLPQRRCTTRWLIPTLGAIVAVGIGLIGGIAIGQNTASDSAASSSAFGRQFGPGAGAGGTGSGGAQRAFGAGGFISGTVVSVSGDKLVVKSATGTDITVTTTSTTRVTKQQSVTLSDLTAGERVTAVGTPTGSNGAITATTISEGTPFGGGRLGRPGAGRAGTSSGPGSTPPGANG